MLTGAPIVAIITGLERPSLNKKTGNMAQVMIFDANERPTDALESLADENVCGDCPLRKNVCYVNLGHFNKVWDSYKSGNTAMLSAEIQCPNIANPSIQCSNCRLCSGSERKLLHISIEVHGFNHKVKAFERLTTAQQ